MSEIYLTSPGEKVAITLPDTSDPRQEYIIKSDAGHRVSIALPQDKSAERMREALRKIILILDAPEPCSNMYFAGTRYSAALDTARSALEKSGGILSEGEVPRPGLRDNTQYAGCDHRDANNVTWVWRQRRIQQYCQSCGMGMRDDRVWVRPADC